MWLAWAAAAVAAPIDVARVVVNDTSGLVVAGSGDEYVALVTSGLRAAGYDAHGDAAALFGSAGGPPGYELGAIASAGACVPADNSRTCEVTVEWQVYDTSAAAVIYSVTTRGLATDAASLSDEEAGRRALADALSRLLARPAFAAAVSGKAAATPRVQRCTDAAVPADGRAMSAVVGIRDGSSVGTGTIVSPDGFVVTADHLLVDATPQVILADGSGVSAQIVRRDAAADVALLRVSGSALACLPLGGPPQVGEALVAVGPARGGASPTSRGTIAATRDTLGWQQVATDPRLDAGHPGAPLVDVDGRLVAVATANFSVSMPAIADRLGVTWSDGSSATARGIAVQDVDDPDRLPARDDTIEAANARVRRRMVGAPFVAVGGVALTGGLTTLVYTYVRERSPGLSADEISRLKVGKVVGWAATGGGLALCIVGSF